MTEATQQSAPATDPRSCPECSKLIAFAEIDELIAAGVASPGQMTQHDELAREISGNPQSGESVAAVLARALADERHRAKMMARVEAKADELLKSLSREFGRERLAKDTGLAILPSGNAISLRGIREVRVPLASSGGLLIWYENAGEDYTSIDNPTDAAAIRAALHKIGVSINAPTIAGEDRDADGRTGE